MKLSLTGPARRLACSTMLLALLGLGCSDDGSADEVERTKQADVIRDYGEVVDASYADSLSEAKALHEAIQALVDAPSEKTLADAKAAWLKSRDPYGETEAYRFYNGPIDNEIGEDDIPDGPEGAINAWPIDEGYIDYVVDEKGDVVEALNIINSGKEIDKDLLLELNAAESETSISTGYHAIEFLLWGQDLSADGPGARPYTDYVVGAEGTGGNQARRGQYLLAAADLLVEQLDVVHEAWSKDGDSYRAYFMGLPQKEALSNILLGMGSLTKGELSRERMGVAYDNRDQEDEHSCFSDNTVADLRNNATSVQNVLLGRYADFDGYGLDELVAHKNEELAETLRTQIQDVIDAIDDIPEPFDQAIQGEDDAEGRQAVAAAIAALQLFSDTLEVAAEKLDVPLSLDEE
jgi:putative iron-regulated protein